MGSVNFRTTKAEDEVIATRMLIAGDPNKTEHFKRVYFGAGGNDDQALGELRREISVLTETVTKMTQLLSRMAKQQGDGLELKMLAGIFSLLYPSVDQTVQNEVDQHLDIEAIRGFLAEKKGKR